MSASKRKILAVLFSVTLALCMAALVFGFDRYYAKADTDITVTGVLAASKDNEMYVFHIKLSSKPAGSEWAYYSDEHGVSDVPDQILLNGKTVRVWNSEYRTTAAEWTFNKFPMNTAGFYEKMPVALRSSGGNTAIEVYIHENMYPIIKGDSDSVILKICDGLIVKDNQRISGDYLYEISGENGSFTISAAEEEPELTEIETADITVSGWIHQSEELRVFYINFPNGTLPEISYAVMDNDNYKYIAEYITVNGVTVKDINENTDVSGYTFSVFPSSADDKYKVPVMICVNNDKIEMKIHDSYYAELEDDLTVSVLQGLAVLNGNVQTTVSEDVTFTRKHGMWSNEWQSEDITDNVSVSGWTHQDDELRVFYISVGNGVLPSGIAYGIIDNDDYKYIAEYITINGKSIKEINEEVDTSDYTFSVFPSSADAKYRLPIMVLVEGGEIAVKIHDRYYETLDGDLTVSVLNGLMIVNGSTEYVLTEDVTFTHKHGMWSNEWQSEDITDNVSVSGWTHQSNELRVFYISVGNGVLPSGISYGIIDNDDYKYIAEYITINGKTIKEINEETDVSDYTFSVFPSSADAKYRLPIMVLVEGGEIAVKIHDRYYESLDGDLTVSVLNGLMIVNGSTEYVLTEDVTFTRKHGMWSNEWQSEDITDNVSVSGWTHQSNELRVFYISVGNGVLPSGIAYGIIDNDDYKYIAEYITINGKTIKEINEEVDTSDYTFSVFPSSADAKYRLPIMVLVEGGEIAVKIHDRYYETLDGDLTVSVLNGLMIVNGSTEYAVTEDVTFTRKHGMWSSEWQSEDITDNVSVSGWTHQSNELRVFYISVGNGVLPSGIAYGIIDNDDYKYIAEYITINGKTIKEINEEVDTSDYTFTVFPSSADAKYRLPIMVLVEGGEIAVKIHDRYYESLDGDLTISVLNGLMIVNGSTEYVVTEDVTYSCKHGTWNDGWQTKDVTADITVSGWIHQSNELRVFFVSFGEGVVSDDISYGIIGKDEYKYIAEFITINGKSIKEINEETDVSDYTFNVFPSSADDKYKVPVIIYANGNEFAVKIHDRYYETLDGDLTVSVLNGLKIINGSTEYAVTEDVTFIRKHGSWGQNWTLQDVTDNVTVSNWIHQGEELMVLFVNFGEGVLPSDIAFKVMDNDDYKYIAEYITINGKTIKEINEETDTSDYTFTVFPSSVDDKYKVPVMIYVSSEKMEIKIHDSYRATLEGRVTVSVLSGLVIVNGSDEYAVGKDRTFILKSDNWIDADEEYTVTYYLNGDPYATETYTILDTIEMLPYPETEIGYEFSGWDKSINKITSGDETINGYISLIKYTITYDVGTGENSPLNPIRYTVESDTIVLSEPTAKGYVFGGWFDKDGNEVKSIEKGSHGDLVLTAKFYQESKSCFSGISGVSMGGIAFIVGGVFILLKRKKEKQ